MNLTPEQKTRAAMFDSLLRMDAWKELERIASDEINSSMSRQDSRDTKDLNMNTVCEEIGFRKGIRWILRQVSTIKEIG